MAIPTRRTPRWASMGLSRVMGGVRMGVQPERAWLSLLSRVSCISCDVCVGFNLFSVIYCLPPMCMYFPSGVEDECLVSTAAGSRLDSLRLFFLGFLGLRVFFLLAKKVCESGHLGTDSLFGSSV